MFRQMILGAAALLVLSGCVQDASTAGMGKAPRGYELLFSPAPYAFRYSVPGEPVRLGAVSERFEWRNGDCGGSDCGNPRARAEIRETTTGLRPRTGESLWYGWSFHNTSVGAVTRSTSLGTVIGQWKLGSDLPPVFRLVQVPGGGTDVTVELEDMRNTFNWGAAQNYGNICRLFSMTANRGKWVDLVVNTNYAADDTGFLRVWVNGELKCNYSGQIVATPGSAPNHRRGIFNSYTAPWDQSQGSAPKPTLIVHYDEYRAGRSREDVDTRMIEASGGRPKD